MDTRETFFTPAKSSFLEKLTPELATYISVFLQKRHFRHLNGVSHYFHRLTNDDYLWRNYFRADFGPIPFPNNAKLQYIAAHFYQLGTHAHRKDLAQIHFRKLHEYLIPYQENPWAFYYLGVQNFQGLGVPINQQAGLNFLLQSLGHGDYRAAFDIASYLILNPTNANSLFTGKDLDKLLPLLIDAYHQGATSAARVIGYLYSDGIGTTSNPLAAEKWFCLALTHDIPEAVSDLVALKFANENLNNNVYKETYLVQLEKTYQTPNVLTEIKFQLSKLDIEHHMQAALPDVAKAREKLVAVAEKNHSGAKKLCGQLSLRAELINEGISYLEKACIAGDEEAAESLCTQFAAADPGNLSLDYFNKLAIASGSSYLFTCIGDHLQFYLSQDDLIHDPAHVWWLQLAAQNGDEKIFEFLEQLSTTTPSSYVFCALGIIYRFGILGGNIMPDITKSDFYFSLAKDCNLESVEAYEQAGKSQGLITPSITQLLEEHMTCSSKLIMGRK